MTIAGSIKSRISIFDISLLVFLLMVSFFMLTVWNDPMASLMLSINFFIIGIYITARFTNFLGFLELSIPTWTISALISIPIWQLLFRIIPSSVGTETAEFSGNLLESFMSQNAIVLLIQAWWFPILESLFVLFLVSFFVGVSLKRKKFSTTQKRGLFALIPLILVSAFASIIHTKMAFAWQVAGLSFNYVLVHQFLTFFILIVFSFIFFAPALISMHVVKNLLVYGSTFDLFVAFAVFVILDILSLLNARRKEKKMYSARVNKLV